MTAQWITLQVKLPRFSRKAPILSNSRSTAARRKIKNMLVGDS